VTDLSNNRVSTLESYVTDLSNNRVSTLEGYVTDLSNNRVSILESYVTDLSNNRVSTLESYVTDLSNNRVSTLKGYVTDLSNNRVSTLEGYVTDLSNNRVSTLETSFNNLFIGDVTNLQTTLNGKQNILKAGTNISIDSETNTISASGSGGTTLDASTDITVANITCDNITSNANSTIQEPTITATNTLNIGTDNVATLIGNKQDKLNDNSIDITTGDITCKNIFSTLNQGNIISGSKIQASDINVNNQDVITLIGKKQNVITIIDNLIYIILCILFHLQSRLRQVQLEMEKYKLPI